MALGLGSGIGTTPSALAAGPQNVATGSYEGACATGQQSDFAKWRGVPNTAVLDALDQTQWSQVENPDWWINCYRNAPFTITYAVPMLINGGDSLEQGAAGAYNGHYLALARNLVAGGEATATLRLGWEFNGDWYKWSAQKNPAAFIAYWRNIVTTMRSVPGAKFTFNWTVSNGHQKFNGQQAWPGNDVVDQIGIDVYDTAWDQDTYPYPAGASAAVVAQHQENAWNVIQKGDQGLDYWAAFAAAHGKSVNLPEWGIVTRDDGHGGGDNPIFIGHIYDWIRTHNVTSAIYFDFNGDGDSRLRVPGHERAAARFLQLFGSGGVLTSTGSPSAAAGVGKTTPGGVQKVTKVARSQVQVTATSVVPGLGSVSATASASAKAVASAVVGPDSNLSIGRLNLAATKDPVLRAKTVAAVKAKRLATVTAKTRAIYRARLKVRAKVRALLVARVAQQDRHKLAARSVIRYS